MTDQPDHLMPTEEPPLFPSRDSRPPHDVADRPEPAADLDGPAAGRGALSVPQDNSILAVIARAASDPAVDVSKMQALLDMQERLMTRQAEIEFNQALASLPAIRVKKNGHIDLGSGKGGYAFAKWEDMDRVISPMLHNAGFRLTFDSQPRQGDGGGIVVTATLLHRNGHSRSASMGLALDSGAGRNNLQAMGSSLAYGKRYTSEMLLNIVREGDDDDGVKGGDEAITDLQVAELSREMSAAGFVERAMYDLLGVTALTEVRKSQLAIARNAIAMRQRQRGKA